MIRRLLYHLGIIDLVWTIDIGGEVRLRTVWYQDDKKYAFGICTPLGFRDIQNHARELLSDGKLGQGRPTYMKAWISYEQRPEPQLVVGRLSCLRRKQRK